MKFYVFTGIFGVLGGVVGSCILAEKYADAVILFSIFMHYCLVEEAIRKLKDDLNKNKR